MQLPLVVSDLGLCNRALDIVALALGSRVVRREHSCGRANDRTHLVVHLLGLGLIDQLAGHKGTGRGITGGAVGGNGHARVPVQAVVVVGRGAHFGACLAGLGQVDVGMRGWERRVDGADDGAVSEGGHFGGMFSWR